MSFIRPPSRSRRKPHRPEQPVQGDDKSISEMVEKNRHPARLPWASSWHPAAAAARRAQEEPQQQDVAEQEPEPEPEPESVQDTETDLSEIQLLGRRGHRRAIPDDLKEVIGTPTDAVGGEVRVDRDRFGRRHIVADEDGQPLHPALQGDAADTSTRHKWRKSEDREEALKMVSDAYGGTRVDVNGWPIQAQEQEPAAEPEDKPGPSEARQIADSLDVIMEIGKSNPDLVRAILAQQQHE